MFQLEPEEELIKTTKPHTASFLSSPMFLIGALFLLLILVPTGLIARFALIRLSLVVIGLLLIGVSYIRRVAAYTFHFTTKRVISDYSFLRKNHREINFDKIIDVKVLQDFLGKVCGYADVWMYGHQNGWVVGRMRGVRLGDSFIIANKAWKKTRNMQ